MKNGIPVMYDQSVPEPGREEPVPATEWDRLQNRRILVVEDDPVSQAFMKFLFYYWNVSADICDNGKEAIALLRRKNYDIVLTDIEMPVMNGFETVELIRNEMQLKVPVIALTANQDSMTRQKAMACGMDDFILKPVNPDILFSRMAFHLGINSTM